MGIFGEGKEQSGNAEEQNCTPKQSTPADSYSCEQNLPCTDSMEEQREPIPYVEKPPEEEIHEEDVTKGENWAVGTGPVEPPTVENPIKSRE